ncbi:MULTISPECIES: DUF1292 domain-containing protein [Priestia]|jgi:uncharacterized protein YrzB (UPF0473 family)|uniref:DUF1292 domain-containing protein n=12 Tax=Priestia TaxID=2800373 RepID=D5DS12_PRIM1|nr:MULTISPECIES: DUF1292 domain-containing protein [Priestia]KOP74538.1 cyclopropane-fatty-acyl-phospholipid synthase [Bacillus sp. FJAT-21351]KQU19802.1 cyclopropane-fatty-acyl-phospholipid synthase [Bacillus sp. Leaf75]KRD91315.1 cyclopropane-fatty-acyl-phospholipid synthase [Bacillus sp. Root147]KRF55835.1 cyclopropane-fatty-acyl-phospholipid synthase [Bacillus sp. Soil531]MBK0004936.1 DUF1292 domain-containing protein [Bacillus sp. S35]MBK0292289.1 DUF1292 domain-containing protein [Bacil
MERIETGEIFTILDENDQEQDIEVLGKMTIEGHDYIAVAFVEEVLIETEEEIDVFFLKIEDDGEWSSIEDDDEFEKVSAVFEEMTSA